MSDVVTIKQLEAARAACVAALNSCQSALLTVDALIVATDHTEPAKDADDFSGMTFEDDPAPQRATTNRRANGKR